MDRKQTLEALEEIRDSHIAETAAPPKKRKRIYWLGAAAAALTVVVCFSLFSLPVRIQAQAVSLPGKPRITAVPKQGNYDTWDAWKAADNAWGAERDKRRIDAQNAVSALSPFFTKGSAEFLAGNGSENRLWSPVNAYIGLAMLTELTEGESRQQILDLFGTADLNELRTQTSAIWETVYQNNGNEICTLANSLWLEEGLTYDQKVMDDLAYHYYASVYRGDLGSEKINGAIGAWLNNNTGGLLKKATENIALSQETVLALYSTLYFQAKWSDQFSAKNNTKDVFYGPESDIQAVYMNKKQHSMTYFWGENFSAVCMSLKNGSCMWFILPDEGKTPADVLEAGSYMRLVTSDEWENQKEMLVNLSVPKFDISGTQNLQEGLANLGISAVFDPKSADFTAITSEVPVVLAAANQSVRVQIDEEGVKAAAYIEFPGAGSAAPPEEIIDFVLNRPFLFVVTSQEIPLFAGCVNEP